MTYIMFPHEEQSNQHLNSESFDQVKRESLEIVHLYKLVEVHTKYFEGDHQVLSEDEMIILFDDVFLIIRVILIKCV